MHVGFLCPHNPYSMYSFSGTAHHMYKGLARASGITLRVLGHSPPSKFQRLQKRLGIKQKEMRVKDHELDGLDCIIALLFGPALESILESSKIPVVYVTDATPGFLRDFYGWDIPDSQHTREKSIVELSARTVYSSEFMMTAAVQEFGSEFAHKMAAVPFGVNIDDLPVAATPKTLDGKLELLFVGREWERKGGEIALRTQQALSAKGVPTRLTVIGCNPSIDAPPDEVEIAGLLDKGDPAQYKRFQDAFRRANFFLLPTRADCTPMVVGEANAYSAPALVTNVGGIASLVVEEQSGFMFSLEETGDDYAQKILSVIEDRAHYEALCVASFENYKNRLNWDSWSRDVLAIAGELSGA